jgi:hypothetical protein
MTTEATATSPLLLRLRRLPGPTAATPFESAEVSYLGDDVYRFLGNTTSGEKVDVSLLSRQAAVEFLDLMLRQEHEGEVALVSHPVPPVQLEDVSAPALSRCLLLLRDTR